MMFFGVYKEFDVNNNLILTKTVKHGGKIEGEFKEYHPNSNIKVTGKYVNGKLDGEYKEFHPNSNVKVTGKYVNGELDGEYKEFHPNSNIKVTCKYVNGKLDGEYKEFYSNKNIWFTGKYINGNKDGKWRYYNEENTYGYNEYRFNNGVEIINCQIKDKQNIGIEMSQMDKRVIEIQHGGNRKYYVRYLYTKRNGEEGYGDQIINYSGKEMYNCEFW